MEIIDMYLQRDSRVSDFQNNLHIGSTQKMRFFNTILGPIGHLTVTAMPHFPIDSDNLTRRLTTHFWETKTEYKMPKVLVSQKWIVFIFGASCTQPGH